MIEARSFLRKPSYLFEHLYSLRKWDAPDKNLQFQQNLFQFDLAVIVLQAPSNRLADLIPLVPKVLELLEIAPKGQATVVTR